MEQINNWNILMFISFAYIHIDGLVTTEPELPKHCNMQWYSNVTVIYTIEV